MNMVKSDLTLGVGGSGRARGDFCNCFCVQGLGLRLIGS